MNKSLVVQGVVFEFKYDELENRWLLPRSGLLLPGFELGMEIGLEKYFPGDRFTWEELQGFLDYWMSNQADYRELVKGCEEILHMFLAKADGDVLTTESLAHIRLVPGSILYKGAQPGDWPKYEFEIVFYPLDLRDPYEDMGSLLWRATFLNRQLFRIERDL